MLPIEASNLWPRRNRWDMEYVIRYGFRGPLGDIPCTWSDHVSARAANLLHIGNDAREWIPRTSAEGGMQKVIQNYLSRIGIIEHHSPGAGFYLCTRMALAAALGYFHIPTSRYYLTDPVSELDDRSMIFMTGSGVTPIEATINSLVRQGAAERHALRSKAQAYDVAQHVFSGDGALLIRHRLLFPELGKKDNRIQEFGHWIAVFAPIIGTMGKIGGLLSPYGITGYYADADISAVLGHVDPPEGMADATVKNFRFKDHNAVAFYPNRVDYMHV